LSASLRQRGGGAAAADTAVVGAPDELADRLPGERELLRLELEEEGSERLLLAPILDVDDPSAADVVEQGEEATSPTRVLLIDADDPQIELLARIEPAHHRTLHDPVSLIPADVEELRPTADARLFEHSDRQRLKEESEARLV